LKVCTQVQRMLFRSDNAMPHASFTPKQKK
jgi:hypothetical protein